MLNDCLEFHLVCVMSHLVQSRAGPVFVCVVCVCACVCVRVCVCVCKKWESDLIMRTH